MQWYFLVAGLLLLAAAGILTHLLRRHVDFSRFLPYRRIPLSRSLLQLLRKAAVIQPALCADLRMLATHVIRVGRDLADAPPLPTLTERLPRMLCIAETLLDEASFTASALQNELSSLPDEPLHPSEAAYFPLCVEAAQCRRLEIVLSSMLRDAKEHADATCLIRRLKRSRTPLLLLESSKLHSAGMAALLAELRANHETSLLAEIDQWLASRDTSSERIAAQALERELRFAEEIRQAEECFSTLSKMNWLPHCETVDPIHRLLLDDPSGIYARMENGARLELRLQIERFALSCRMQPEELLQHALHLSQEAEENSLEAYIGYWFQDASGMHALHRTLHKARGWLYARTTLRQDSVGYAYCLLFGIIFGFLFLQAGQPVFMLPFFALCAGSIIRALLSRRDAPSLPAMDVAPMLAELRTLVVLPALLTDSHDAIRQVRRLKTLRHTFPESCADFLLLGDFADNMTAVSSNDAAIIQAATSAISALEDSRCHYLQRGRTWNPDMHICSSRGGRRGAVTAICRLIAQGECEDTIACSTVEPASLERKYAYILVLKGDRQPAPGMLKRLLTVMTHPMCSRFPAPGGWRGYSVLSAEGTGMFEGTGLVRPDAYLEATDGLVYDSQDADALCGELSGHTSVPGAAMENASPDTSWEALYRTSRQRRRLALWQLPWVQTPSGLIRNPLRHLSRFRLREMLRETLVPFGQSVLLLWSVPTGSWLLFLLALAAPELSRLPRRLNDWLALLRRLSLLPMRAFLPLHAIWDILRKKAPPTSFVTFEVWTQGIAATLMIALGLAFPGMALPALTVGALFACFPLAHKYDGTLTRPPLGLTEEHSALLEHLAEGTWRYFCENISAENRHLPPCSVQFDPPAGPESATSPEAIASSLLACVCAKELDFISANEAAAMLRNILTSLAELSMPFGLPCRRYALPSLTVQDARVDASGAGLLFAALMTAAQALRTWLPELDSSFVGLSAEAEKHAGSFAFDTLYDAEADLFHLQLDENGQGVGHVTCFADEALLLSVAACARRLIPPRHFLHLSHACVRLRGSDIPLSRNGTATAHLLAGLFLPIREHGALDFIAAMQDRAHNGLWGQSRCGYFSFDPSLRYKRADFGVQESAIASTAAASVYTPYAAALSLPFDPHAAGEALLRFHSLGASSPLGMCDAVDFTQGQALVGLHDTLHQGIVLMSIAHILADAPVQRFFSGLPEVEACMPLLNPRHAPLLLPVLPAHNQAASSDSTVTHTADPLTAPADIHLTGTADFRILTDAWGSSAMYDHGIPLTRFEPAARVPQGIQFYLADEGRVYRIGDPHQSGQVLFAPGEAQFEQVCGSLKAELVTIADTVRRRSLHVLTITNLSTRDRVIDAADCLLPDLGVPQDTTEVRRPERHRLMLSARGSNLSLHHTLSCSLPPRSLTVCTDAAAFLGRNRTLHAPASLEEPAADMLTLSTEPCLSFRVRLTLVGRGQAMLWFTTSLQEHDPPQLAALPGLRKLAALQHEAIDAANPLDKGQCDFLRRLLPLLVQSEYRIALQRFSADDVPELTAIVTSLDWLHLHGVRAEAWISCPSESHESIRQTLAGHACEDQITLSEDTPPPHWMHALVLHGNTSYFSQLEARYSRLLPESTHKQPHPALLPKTDLEHRSTYGGFDPQTGDYIIELEPGMTTSAPWENIHASRMFRETVDESGFRAPFDEQLWITLPDGTALSPWSQELPRSIRMAPGMTNWEAWSDQLDLRLSAACLPGHRCGLRILRLRNATDAPLDIRLTVHAPLGVMLDCVGGVVMSSPDGQGRCAFLAGDGWTAQRFTPNPLAALDSPPNDMPDQPEGRIALTTTALTLPPLGSGEASWLAGFARHAEDVARSVETLRQSGKSALLRAIQANHAQPLNALTVSTPEDTFDLLMNSILPRQALTAEGSAAIPALVYLAPQQAKWRLLEQARRAHTREEWAEFSLHTVTCIRITGDKTLPDAWLPQQDKTLFAVCKEALLSLPLDHRGLPLGEDAEHRCLLYAIAAQELHRCTPDPELAEFSRKLLNAADTYLWADICYGTPMRLDVQALSCIAYGANPRTRQSMRTAWMTLYDPFHGLIRRQEPAKIPPLPGLPENGGMFTTDAILTLRALLLTAHNTEAHELMRALNPIHHGDDLQRMETFRCAPYRLHGGMHAYPLEAGRAVADGGNEAAALLYAILLEDVLGLHREGSTLRIRPHVPPDWDDYALTLREGSSTWHISVERSTKAMTIDGEEVREDAIVLHDDGRIHQVRVPLK